jgi:hypothetical protein
MDNYSDLFSQHEPDPLLRELNGNILWYWKPMDPHDKRMGCVSNAPFEACDRIKILERELAEERHSREVAAKHAWRFSDALRKIIEEDLQTTRHKDGSGGETVFDGYFGGIARAALEDKA